ncbi:MAG: type II toxin-antitoxin system HicB family antitoxin [Verrucomicrobiota bacterium]
MLSTYLERAMRLATYEKTETGSYFGSIPVMPGVWSEAGTLEQCRRELLEVLEEWIILSLKRGDTLPVVDGCDLNQVAEHA